LEWVRTQLCAVIGCGVRQCDPAHVRRGTDGGTGVKPGDNWVNPLCRTHHHEQHQVGEPAFERRHGLDLKALAAKTWGRSPVNRNSAVANFG
jgi:hypothetical protein